MRLPNGNSVRKQYKHPLFLTTRFRERVEHLVAHHPREVAVLVFIIDAMDENGVYKGTRETIASGVGCSQMTVSRVIRLLKDEYSDLLTITKLNSSGNRFEINASECFKVK